MEYLKTMEVPFNWMGMRDILVVKSKYLEVIVGEKGSSASTGWVVPLYNKTSTMMEGWWRYATPVGSSEGKK